MLSGNGSNFQAIVEHFKNVKDIEVAMCISNKKDAYGIQRAKNLDVKYKIFELNDFKTRQEQEKAISETLSENKIDLVVLAGYMLILKFDLLEWSQRMINVHPSLLPKFPGKSAIKDTFYAGEQRGGITIHFVDSGVDTGEIIEQVSIMIDRNKGIEKFEKQIHELEWKYYPKIIEKTIRSK
ncbi:phosphoribosylglycinamide formyltransferase [Mycoplasma todarodis]|uniref:Phosphoribosylglycinamide formyltransferase n=2 Tax=Mycoplasma todarodis TaxID=1937191 RepID=A0A4V2NI15_9MOLU|nr:phosphoribosylglycinamide formyltransferase [Mycoplasma todarodis]